MVVVDAETAHGRVGGVIVEMRGADLCNLAPGRQVFGSNVVPFLAAVASLPDQAIVGSSPKRINVLERWGESIDDSPLFLRTFRNQTAHAGWNAGTFTSQIVADGLPRISAVGSFEEHVAGEVKHVRIERREHGGLGAVRAIFRITKRDRGNVLHLAGGPVKLRNLASAAAVNNVRIERIGCDITVLDYADRMPFAEGDGAIVPATGDAGGTTLLLAAADAIGKIGSYGNMVELRGGLVVPGTPGRSASERHQGALIADQKNNVRIVGVDPQILIVVAARRPAKTGPGFAAVVGLHGYGAGAINDVRILGIYFWNGKVAAADASGRARIISRLVPAFSSVVGTVDRKHAGSSAESGIETMAIAGSNGDVNLREIFRETVGQRMPGVSAIGGLE